MNKLICMSALALVSVGLVGCKTTVDDCFRSDLRTDLVAAKFKPTVEVIKEQGIVKGTAKKRYCFWWFNYEEPDSFAHEINGVFSSIMIPTLYNAAVYDACKKSGASILLAPKFTVTATTSFLGFSGEKMVSVEGVPARIIGAEEIPVEKWPEIFGTQSGTQKVISVPAK